MYPRILTIDPQSRHSFFLFGPRGTGKTSWVTTQFTDHIYFDFLDLDLYTEFLTNPHILEQKIPKGCTQWIIIDEIQKIPLLLNEVHRLIEKYRYRFILTGSSARTLRRKGVNLLAGRALLYRMYPLTSLELGDDFDLKRALQYGLLPAAVSMSNPEKYLTSYVGTYLREEVLQEGLTKNLDAFARFLEIASFSQGEVVSFTAIGREVAVDRKTIMNYFSILDDLLIGSLLPVFRRRAKRDLIRKQKFYFFDVGVYRSIRPRGPFDSPEEIEGPALETLLYQELRAINDYYELGYKLYYWRTRSKVEVDFVLYGKHGLHAFEIKRKSALRPSDFKGLRMFGSDYPEAKLHMIYGGWRDMHNAGVEVYSIHTFFPKLKEILLSQTTQS